MDPTRQGTCHPVPFEIAVPEAELRTLRRRVAGTRFPRTGPTGWDLGPDDASMRGLAAYWGGDFDWRAQERRLNGFAQFRVRIGGDLMHFVHVRSPHSRGRAVVLLHGWPYSFASLLGLVGPLVRPGEYEGSVGDAVDVVVPSLPGFAFSDVGSPVGPRATADRVDALMTQVLGYGTYRAHGGAWGAVTAGWLGHEHRRCVAIGITGAPIRNTGLHKGVVDPGTGFAPPEDRAGNIAAQETAQLQLAYYQQQSYRPTPVGYLADSPVGAAAWIVDKYYLWSDRRTRAFEEIFTRDQLLTEIMLYVATGAFDTSLWMYKGGYDENGSTLPLGGRITVPTGFAGFPDPLQPPPTRADLEKVYDVVQYATYTYGGHFPFYENPAGLLDGVRGFLRATDTVAVAARS
ncbi:epoxide hydrolase family protein [Streptomyces sp. NPDC059718]